jgi:hypothetical protein
MGQTWLPNDTVRIRPCRRLYSRDYSIKCIDEQMRGSSLRTVQGTCREKTFTDFNGDRYLFLGKTPENTDDTMAKFSIRDFATAKSWMVPQRRVMISGSVFIRRCVQALRHVLNSGDLGHEPSDALIGPFQHLFANGFWRRRCGEQVEGFRSQIGNALPETAIKEIIKGGLKLKLPNRFVGAEALVDFVEGLPVNGKTSLLHLLKDSGCPDEDSGFIEAVRRVRNAYAHNIKFADLPLIELIKRRLDKSNILKSIGNIRTYEEAALIASFEKDGTFLRFCILDATMRILFYAYHLALK